MRAFVCGLAISLAAAGGAAQAPRRVASLNLCTDELVLLLARADQIASVTHLSRDRLESPLWRPARLHPANDGSLLSVAAMRPDLIFAMGGGGRDRQAIATALGARLVVLDYPASLDDVAVSVAIVAEALGRPAQGKALLARLAHARATVPQRSHDAIYLTGGGRSMAATGAGAEWLRLAGLRQRPLPGDRVNAEMLLLRPPQVVLASDYRAGQISRERAWLTQPVLRRPAGTRKISTDGRRWTCMGPTLLPEVMRLRAAVSAAAGPSPGAPM